MVEALRSRDLASGNAEDINRKSSPSPTGAVNPPGADPPEEEAMENSEQDAQGIYLLAKMLMGID